jgi:hypothetical protein
MKLRGSLVLAHTNTTMRSVGSFEAVRLEVVRLAPPLPKPPAPTLLCALWSEWPVAGLWQGRGRGRGRGRGPGALGFLLCVVRCALCVVRAFLLSSYSPLASLSLSPPEPLGLCQLVLFWKTNYINLAAVEARNAAAAAWVCLLFGHKKPLCLSLCEPPPFRHVRDSSFHWVQQSTERGGPLLRCRLLYSKPHPYPTENLRTRPPCRLDVISAVLHILQRGAQSS